MEMSITGTAYYEIHVTFDTQPFDIPGRWKLSKIDGDPDLGTGTRWYLTAHVQEEPTARLLIGAAKELWPHARRYKIEHVIFDEKKEHYEPPPPGVIRR